MTSRRSVPSRIAHLPITNQELESSFHDRTPADLASWLIPASFRPAPSASHQHKGHHTEQGVLRVAPKKILSSFELKTHTINSWQSDWLWLICFALVFGSIYYFVVRDLMFSPPPLAGGGDEHEKFLQHHQQQQQYYYSGNMNTNSNNNQDQFAGSFYFDNDNTKTGSSNEVGFIVN